LNKLITIFHSDSSFAFPQFSEAFGPAYGEPSFSILDDNFLLQDGDLVELDVDEINNLLNNSEDIPFMNQEDMIKALEQPWMYQTENASVSSSVNLLIPIPVQFSTAKVFDQLPSIHLDDHTLSTVMQTTTGCDGAYLMAPPIQQAVEPQVILRRPPLKIIEQVIIKAGDQVHSNSVGGKKRKQDFTMNREDGIVFLEELPREPELKTVITVDASPGGSGGKLSSSQALLSPQAHDLSPVLVSLNLSDVSMELLSPQTAVNALYAQATEATPNNAAKKEPTDSLQECEHCHKMFKLIRQHKCKMIPKAFVQPFSPLEAYKKFTCVLCRKTFRDEQKYIDHMNNHEAEKAEGSPSKRTRRSFGMKQSAA
jgi:hypothetical protein